MTIDVGGGPSGLSIEGPFCRTVHLCCTLGERKIEKNKDERRKSRNKKERNEKKRKILFIFYALLFF